MNINRGEVSEFQYASASLSGRQIITTISSASPVRRYSYRITDIALTAATAMNLKVFVSSVSGQPLRLKCAANSGLNVHFQVPYKLNVVSSTVEPRRFIASTNTTGGNVIITGYMEKN